MVQESTVSEPAAPLETSLTPREMRLERSGDVLWWGAIVNGIAALLISLIGLMVGAGVDAGLLRTASGVLLGRFGGADDLALLVVVLLLLVNVSALLVLMVGILAQELWAVLLTVFAIIANGWLLIWLGFSPALITLVVASYALWISVADIRAFRLNPVMLKELRGRMRGARAFVVMTVYLGLMSGFAVLLYLIQRSIVMSSGSAVTGELGRVLFAGVVGVQLLLIIFIAPAFTAGAVSNERERKTYDLLQITLLPKPSFIIGKLESALGYIVLLLLAAIPLQSIAFLFGGVSETELILAFVILGVTALTLGTVGLYFSTTVDRTLTASVRAYTAAFTLTIVTWLGALIVGSINSSLVGRTVALTDPGLLPLMEAILTYLEVVLVSLNPIATATATQQLLIEQQQLGFWTATLATDGSTIPMVAPWISFTVFYLAIATGLVVLAVRRIRQVEE